METKFKLLTGTAKQVETELNNLKKDYSPIVQGMSSTNEFTIVIIELYPK